MKAIQTEYAGCLFRSRLEARWAVFFDHLDVDWEHEPEGFETPAGRYLPDFRVHATWPFWFEVKPPDAPIDRRHAALGDLLIVARGLPRDYASQLKFLTMHGDGGRVLPIAFSFYEPYGGLNHYMEPPGCPRTDAAYRAARSARFGT